MGTYENPTNCGDGHAMAYHAGADLANLECFQINPLIKDYNGPACAYVTGPFGGFTANSKGERFIECDYWSGQMMMEFYNELEGGNGPVFLKLDHLAEETIQEIETILHTNERPSRGRFHEKRGNDYRKQMVEMHISEIGFCSGHSASGIHTNAMGETSVPGLYAAGDCASVPHNYMLGAFVYGRLCGENAAAYCAGHGHGVIDTGDVAAEERRILAPLGRTDGLTPYQIEYKTRRLVNDYLQPPKITRKYEIALRRFDEIREDAESMFAANPHELMRAMEAHFHSRLRGNGGAGLDVPHRKPLGPLPLFPRSPGARRRELVLPFAAQQGRGRPHADAQEGHRALHRADRRRRAQRLPAPARRHSAEAA
jgi:succinate dehydrogenase/fumarate reductase flavoprotein subunit